VANEELKSIAADTVTVVSADLTEGGKVTPLANIACPTGAACDIVHFQVSAGKPTAPPVTPLLSGYTAPKAWSPVAGTASRQTCPGMYEWIAKKPAATAAGGGSPAPQPAPGQDGKNPVKTLKERLIGASDIKSAHDLFKQSRDSYGTSPMGTVGTAQMDLSAATAETLQILGQIVVDRASNKAYGLLQDRVEALLDCQDKSKSHFPATCAAVVSLRIQDLAMAPTVLFNALAKDLVSYVGTSWPGVSSKTLGAGVFASSVVPMVARPSVAQDATIRAIVDALSSYVAGLTLPNDTAKDASAKDVTAKDVTAKDVTAKDAPKEEAVKLDAAQWAVVLGVVAYAKCAALNDGASRTLAQCDIGAIVDQLGKDHESSKAAALALASRLLSIAIAASTDKQRVRVAVDTLCDTSCMLELNADPPALACADVDKITDLNVPNLAANDIAFLEASIDAALAADSGRIVVVASEYVDLLLKQQPDESLKKKRALRLLGGLLDYGATFADSSTPQDQVSQTKIHDQRTKILESLTTDMTDRTGRGGDDVFSLGGALRLAGGARLSATTSGAAVYGPISLPLGIAYTHIPKQEHGWGFHAQIDIFDLGNYVTFDQGPKVKTPEVGDALSIGVSAGAAYGTGLPLVIAPTVGYTPQFQLDPNQPDKRGAWNFGLTVGVHVPLIDLN
jgi:hypothetical protein